MTAQTAEQRERSSRTITIREAARARTVHMVLMNRGTLTGNDADQGQRLLDENLRMHRDEAEGVLTFKAIKFAEHLGRMDAYEQLGVM